MLLGSDILDTNVVRCLEQKDQKQRHGRVIKKTASKGKCCLMRRGASKMSASVETRPTGFAQRQQSTEMAISGGGPAHRAVFRDEVLQSKYNKDTLVCVIAGVNAESAIKAGPTPLQR